MTRTPWTSPDTCLVPESVVVPTLDLGDLVYVYVDDLC